MTTPLFNNGGSDTSVTPETTRVHRFPLPPEGRQFRPSYKQGQYVLPPVDPSAPRVKTTRATTVAHALDDQSGLDRWKTRQVVRGLVEMNRDRPDALDEYLSIDLDADMRDVGRSLDEVVGAAQDIAGSSYGAELGTAIHAWTEAVERDGVSLEDVPGQFRPYVGPYLEELAKAGVVSEPGMVERIVSSDRWESAGTFDRLYRLPDGTLAIGDVKTSKVSSLNYSWLGWACQFAIYAGADRMLTVDGSGYEPMPEVRQDLAVVAHIPSDQPGRCSLITVDLAMGREALEAAATVRNLRAHARKLIPNVHPLPTAEPSLEDLVRRCRTQDELATLWDMHQAEWSDGLTSLGMSMLR